MGHLARQGLWKSATSCCAFLLRTAGQPGVYVKNRLGVHFQRFANEIDIDQAERMEAVHAEIIVNTCKSNERLLQDSRIVANG